MEKGDPSYSAGGNVNWCSHYGKQYGGGGLVAKVKSLSRVQLFATLWTVARQAPPSMGFSRQEYWNGLPFPSPMCESEVTQSCPTLSDPMDCSLPGSSIHGILQARVLEWGAIAFSNLRTELIPNMNSVVRKNTSEEVNI